ncbi:MAG: hypothetical protein JW963_10455 [Anaerolineales bacterium]|nr:hypothetical protein [Anaerolineales bacterium]
MIKLIFAFMQAYGGDERESVLLARSLRMFGGELANHPLWLMTPQKLAHVSATTRQVLSRLDVQLNRFEVPEGALKFPFGGKVYAAAAAEAMASGKADVLVWMDSDTVFAGEPAGLTLGENVKLGYRPVMLKNVSSLHDEPLNAFWSFIFERCDSHLNNLFPMITSVDGVRIRPHFNAGILSVRPKAGLLQAWRNHFERLYRQPELAPFYQENILYRIFVHQAILAATALAKLKKDEMQDLGARFNYPLFLEGAPEPASNVVTLRYDEFEFFEQPGWENKFLLKGPAKEWLGLQVRQ